MESTDEEIKRLKQWVDDLHSGMYINCVYCGHRYGPKDKVPVSMSEVLKEHVEKCPKHPMSALKAENDCLKSEIASFKAILVEASKKANVVYVGLDTPDWLARAIVDLRGQIASYEERLREITITILSLSDQLEKAK